MSYFLAKSFLFVMIVLFLAMTGEYAYKITEKPKGEKAAVAKSMAVSLLLGVWALFALLELQ